MTKEQEILNERNAEPARVFCDAIRTLAANPERLENLESYLSYHFDKWLVKWANTPENMAGEMKQFSEIW